MSAGEGGWRGRARPRCIILRFGITDDGYAPGVPYPTRKPQRTGWARFTLPPRNREGGPASHVHERAAGGLCLGRGTAPLKPKSGLSGPPADRINVPICIFHTCRAKMQILSMRALLLCRRSVLVCCGKPQLFDLRIKVFNSLQSTFSIRAYELEVCIHAFWTIRIEHPHLSQLVLGHN
jgi:hypothetical protein